MKNKVVRVPSIQTPITRAPGFEKKRLSTHKLDVSALCAYGCAYCSSNEGNYLRINRQRFLHETADQLGISVLPADDPSLAFTWPDVIDKLRDQLANVRPGFGCGKTLVYSMLTDGFSPLMVETGVTRAALDLVLEKTEFRTRVLTKSEIVGEPEWVSYFAAHSERFVVGLSTGSLDEQWARRIELGTPSPEKRLAALGALQDAGVPTYGMLCPVFPDLLEGNGVERLVDRVRPDRVEHIWAEPYNDRNNWEKVRRGYRPGSEGDRWFTRVYEERNVTAWSNYATDLYLRLRAHAEANGWVHKLRYLLYEDRITAEDAIRLGDMKGILFQSKPDDAGFSRNQAIAALQRAQEGTDDRR